MGRGMSRFVSLRLYGGNHGNDACVLRLMKTRQGRGLAFTGTVVPLFFLLVLYRLLAPAGRDWVGSCTRYRWISAQSICVGWSCRPSLSQQMPGEDRGGRQERRVLQSPVNATPPLTHLRQAKSTRVIVMVATVKSRQTISRPGFYQILHQRFRPRIHRLLLHSHLIYTLTLRLSLLGKAAHGTSGAVSSVTRGNSKPPMRPHASPTVGRQSRST